MIFTRKIGELFEERGARSEFSAATKIPHQNLTKWKNGAVPGVDLLETFCDGSGISANWLVLDMGPKLLADCNFEPKNGKIAGKIEKKDKVSEAMQALEEWIREQPDPERMATRAIVAVEDRYREFEEWQKKRTGQLGNDRGLENVSANGE